MAIAQKQFLFDRRVSRLAAWQAFHAANPVVWQLFLRFAREARAAGRARFGAHAIGERIRWHSNVETMGDPLKLNDHHLPYYARLAMLVYPGEFANFFERRDGRFDASDSDILAAHGGGVCV